MGYTGRDGQVADGSFEDSNIALGHYICGLVSGPDHHNDGFGPSSIVKVSADRLRRTDHQMEVFMIPQIQHVNMIEPIPHSV